MSFSGLSRDFEDIEFPSQMCVPYHEYQTFDEPDVVRVVEVGWCAFQLAYISASAAEGHHELGLTPNQCVASYNGGAKLPDQSTMP